MEWQAWRPLYQEIVEAFGYDPESDRRAAHRLRRALQATAGDSDRFKHVGTELKYRPAATVVGCGPDLESLQRIDFPDGVVVACDGATKRLQELDVLPRIVVTDLDGDPDALAWAGREGASMVVHAHGDNMDAIDAVVPRLGDFVAGTYQSEPEPELAPMRNVGGFTDGDRAVLLCESFGVHVVNLLCFDFDAAPSRYSHHFDPQTKPAKLAWARRIIAGVNQRGKTRVQMWVPEG